MRNLYFLILGICLLPFVSNAQLNHNALVIDNAPYTELTGDIALTDMTFAEGDPHEVKELYGETFNLYSKPMMMDTLTTGILIFPNAFIEVINGGDFVICDALLRYLDSIDNNSKISYKIEGSSGNKILKVQWKNLKLRSGIAGNYVNLQLWLYQKDGMVEYRYGPASASNASGFTPSTGPSVGISYSDTNFASFKEKIWIYGTPPNIKIDSAHNISFPNISGVPSNGTIYRFIPKQSLSVAENQKLLDISAYPSPADKEVIIRAAKAQNETLTITLLDAAGKALKTYAMPDGTSQLSIPTASMPNGMYNIRIQNTSGNITNYKIAVAH